MERNYHKEYEWEKNNFKRYTIKLSKDKALIFDNKLKEENKKYTDFFKEIIDKYTK